MVWAQKELTDYHFLYLKAEWDDKTVSHHISYMLYLVYY